MRTHRFLYWILFATAVFWGCSRESEGENDLDRAMEAGASAESVPVAAGSHVEGDTRLVEEGTGQPVITFAHTAFDFGEVEQGEVVEHIFTFRNTGNADLIIERVRSG